MYLLAQIWWLLLVAFLLGVLLGYVVWRACGLPRLGSLSRRDRLVIEDKCRVLERENARLETAVADAARTTKRLEAEKVSAPVATPLLTAPLASSVSTRAAPSSPTSAVWRGKPAIRPPMPMPPNGNGASHEPLLPSPRNGKADNLRLIRGIGPRLEKTLHAMGVFHFDQIANWTENDLAIIDAHLGDFAGRAVRDNWIAQSRKLAGYDDAPKGL